MWSKGLAPYYKNYMFDAVKTYIFKILPKQKTERSVSIDHTKLLRPHEASERPLSVAAASTMHAAPWSALNVPMPMPMPMPMLLALALLLAAVSGRAVAAVEDAFAQLRSLSMRSQLHWEMAHSAHMTQLRSVATL